MTDPGASGNDSRESRLLAAIVFTDVVGFSKLASQNESRVYVALQRDMGVITSLSRAHGGQVLNTMGDGMLLCFMSAVDAMTCAMEIQRTLFAQSRSLPPQDVLHHRIGVHLGDVIMSGDNVFGDGVNVAARLQSVAKPDGICFSHTVHEVVKNKLKMDPVFVGNQQLKNLGEPIRIWQIPPPSDGKPSVDLVDLPVSSEPPPGSASGMNAVWRILTAVVLLLGLAAGFSMIKLPKPMAKSRPAPIPDVTPGGGVPTPVPSTGGATARTPEQVQSEVNRLRSEFAFGEIVMLLEASGKSAPESELKKLGNYGQLAKLMAYLETEVARSNPSSPIRFTPPGSATEVAMYQVAGQKQLMENGMMRPTSWSALGAANVHAIAQSLSLTGLDRTTPAPPEVRAWTDLFAIEFQLQP